MLNRLYVYVISKGEENVPRNLEDFEKISKAIHASYEMLRVERQPDKTALVSLKEAEMSLHSSFAHFLAQQTRRMS